MSETTAQCIWCGKHETSYDKEFCSKECYTSANEEARLAFLEMEIQRLFEKELLGSVVGQKH